MSPAGPNQPVVVERWVDAPPKTIYSLLTSLDRWLAWQEPGATVDARPGGAFRMHVAGRAWASGRFVELIPNQRVVLTWGWESPEYPVPPGSSRVQIDLIPDGRGTVVRLAHTGLPEQLRDSHRQGWEYHLERLESLTR